MTDVHTDAVLYLFARVLTDNVLSIDTPTLVITLLRFAYGSFVLPSLRHALADVAAIAWSVRP